MFPFFPDPFGRGRYRTLLPWEHRHYAEHLLRLSPNDRRTRFMGSVGDDFIAAHSRRALASAKTKVIGWFHDRVLRATVELCWSKDGAAEAAFSVEALFRRSGVGTALAEHALRAARNRGIPRVTILTEADNVAMRRLGAHFGAKFVAEGREIEATLPVGRADLMSVVFELAEEQRNLALTPLPAKPLRALPGP